VRRPGDLDCGSALLPEDPFQQAKVDDIARLAYTRLAHEGGFDLASRPRVRRWISRCEESLKRQPAS